MKYSWLRNFDNSKNNVGIFPRKNFKYFQLSHRLVLVLIQFKSSVFLFQAIQQEFQDRDKNPPITFFG